MFKKILKATGIVAMGIFGITVAVATVISVTILVMAFGGH